MEKGEVSMRVPEEVTIGAPEEDLLRVPEEDMGAPEEDVEAPEEALPMGRTLRNGLVAASVAAGGIHIWAAVQHAHPRLIAQLVFFVVVATIQFWWAAAVLWIRRLPRSVLIAGAATNAVVVVVWVLSRTTGLPFLTRAESSMDDIIDFAKAAGGSPSSPVRGYVGHPETFGLLDTTASLLEIFVIVAVVLLLVRMRRRSSAVHQEPQADLAGLPGDSPSP